MTQSFGKLSIADLSIVIPLAPGEQSWRQLLGDLHVLTQVSEIILVYPESAAAQLRASGAFAHDPRVQWVSSEAGRAVQLNTGAKASTRPVLWFLHADSRLDASTGHALRTVLSDFQDRVYFFTLKFLADGPALMWLNEKGAWFRSQILQMPFGDQGLLMHNSVFSNAGLFPTHVAYGEDHCFVWQAARAGNPCQATGGVIWTSARKYSGRGWLRTTLRHQALTLRQALPEWWKTRRKRHCQISR